MKNVFPLLLFVLAALHLTAQKTSFINGVFIAPAGTAIVLHNNNAESLSLAAKKDTGTYSRNIFKFQKTLATGSTYSVTVKSAPALMVTKITNGQGVLPINGNGLKVECDYAFDLISRTTNNATFSSFYESSMPAIAGNNGEEGRYVAFISNTTGFGGTSGKYRQLFWRDRNTGITKLITTAENGEAGNGDSNAPSITQDGGTVAFESRATNLIEGDKNGVKDIFVWDSFTGKIQRVSVGPAGIEANGESFEPSITTGEIAYTSSATNLVPGMEKSSTANVFWRNLVTNDQKLLTIDYKTKKPAGGSRPSITVIAGDSTKIAFHSASPNLVPDDKNNLWDIFLHSKNKPLKRISLTHNGEERNQGNESTTRDIKPSISGDGRFVAFATTATNMVPNDKNNAQDVFVVDTQTGKVVRTSVDSKGIEGNGDSPVGQGQKIAINHDGQWTAFNSMATNLGAPAYNFIMHNGASGQTRPVTTEKSGCLTAQPILSGNASYILFGTCPKLDARFPSSGIFAAYTGIADTRFNKQVMPVNK